MRRTIAGRFRVGMLVCLTLAAGCFWSGRADIWAANRESETSRVIDLVEDRLSGAFSFKGMGQVPDFSTLDEIYPAWDGGDPAKARRAWVDKGFVSQKIKYRVDSVYFTSQYSARVRGKKYLEQERRVPFMWWFQSTEEKSGESRFVIFVIKNSQGQWLVRQENEY